MVDPCVWVGFLVPGKGRTCSGRTLASASSSKRKGRPRAAEVETTAEDIKFLGRFQGAPGLISGLSRGGEPAIFAFCSPSKILAYRREIVKGQCLNHVSGIATLHN